MAFSVLLAALPVQAQSARGAKSEFYLAPVFTASKNYSFEGGSTAHSDTGAGLTLGYAYNFDRKKSLGVETSWSSADYRATVAPGPGNPNAPGSISGSMDTWTMRLLGNYNFLEADITPFVTGGLGWTYIDTSIPSGLPQNATRFSYNVGAGVRMELGKGFVRALVSEQWVDFAGSYGGTSWTQYRIDFGVKF
jgi:opacity protein-like surface antigen